MDRRTQRSAEQLGEHIRNWRKLLGLTAQQVCERADISRGTLHRLETGQTVGTDTLLAVARALGQVDQLVAGTSGRFIEIEVPHGERPPRLSFRSGNTVIFDTGAPPIRSDYEY